MDAVRDDNNGALIDPYRIDNKALTTAAANPRDFVDVEIDLADFERRAVVLPMSLLIFMLLALLERAGL